MKQGFWNPFNDKSAPQKKIEDDSSLDEIEKELKEIEF
jgi:hypothetical protein